MPFFIGRLFPTPEPESSLPAPVTAADGSVRMGLPFHKAASVSSTAYPTRDAAEAAVAELRGEGKAVVLEAEDPRQAMEALLSLPLDQPVPETALLLDELRTRRFEVSIAYRLRTFDGAATRLGLAGSSSLTLLEFEDEAIAAAYAARSYSRLRRGIPPAFPRLPFNIYRRGRLVVQDYGIGSEARAVLDAVLGPPLDHAASAAG